MATVLEEYNTEDRGSILLFFLWEKGLNAKKYFLFTVGSVCRVKRFTTGWKSFADDEEVETEVRKCGYVYQCWWRKYREINVFFRVRISHVTYLLILPRTTIFNTF
jgi:hypothetical protein